jgi:hypothetical protein
LLGKKDKVPGPGAYDTSGVDLKIKKDPAFSIGTSMRGDLANSKEKKNIPGPGNYSTLDDSFLKK